MARDERMPQRGATLAEFRVLAAALQRLNRPLMPTEEQRKAIASAAAAMTPGPFQIIAAKEITHT